MLGIFNEGTQSNLPALGGDRSNPTGSGKKGKKGSQSNLAASGSGAAKKGSQSTLAASGEEGKNKNAGVHFPDNIYQQMSHIEAQDLRGIPNSTLSACASASASCLKEPIEEFVLSRSSSTSYYCKTFTAKSTSTSLRKSPVLKSIAPSMTVDGRLFRRAGSIVGRRSPPR